TPVTPVRKCASATRYHSTFGGVMCYSKRDHVAWRCRRAEPAPSVAVGVGVFARRHPRWEVVSPLTHAASLHPSQSRWKVLRSLAFTGRRLEAWDEVAVAVRGRRTTVTDTSTDSCGGADAGIGPCAGRGIALPPAVPA